MPKAANAGPCIRLRGVRQNNLKGFDLDLPLRRLVVVTGLSGSGKSSLAFDTLFAEGQRRYIETFSPYARQFFDRMDKPRVDAVEGIPPAIAVEQRNAIRTTRSTVGTITEVCDYMKVLWPRLARLHCRGCGRPVRVDTPQAVWESLTDPRSADRIAAPAKPSAVGGDPEVMIVFEVPLSEKLSAAESLALVARQGYQRLLVAGRVIRLEELIAAGTFPGASLLVVQDRVRLLARNRARFVEACEQAYHFGKGRLTVHVNSTGGTVASSEASGVGPAIGFSNRLHCAECNLEYRPPVPALFSFNHPVGACPSCKGFGRIISIDHDRALPDRSRTLAGGVVKPWQSGVSAECQVDLLKFCRARRVPTDVPFEQLSTDYQRWVIEGDPGYGADPEHEWPRAWYGVKGYFRWLESKAYKMHVRVLLSRYRSYTTCPECSGRRFQPEALLYRVLATEAAREPDQPGLSLADFYALPIGQALSFINRLAATLLAPAGEPVRLALGEVTSRLMYLVEVGLSYLTLDRPTRTLSGGETERVNLTTCLGSRLVNTLFVLDEPSVGLHPRDTARLVGLLGRLRDAGNTVVVVEHEASVMRAADQIIDLGPGHGETGGHLVFQGSFAKLLRTSGSLTGDYLSGRRRIELPSRRPVGAKPGANGRVSRRRAPGVVEADPAAAPQVLRLEHASRHNLKDLTVDIPLGRFVCITGVSGSGKSTLVRDCLVPILEARLGSRAGTSSSLLEPAGDEPTLEPGGDVPPGAIGQCRIYGSERLGRVVAVDQSPLGRTPRSNPAVYLGAFDDLRDLFAASEAARQRGLNASAFSFNSGQGQCERCRGAGFEKIEMQFLSDVFIRCPDCDGRRYRAHILEVKVEPAVAGTERRSSAPGDEPAITRAQPCASVAWSIADLLEASVDETLVWLGGFGDSRPARRARAKLGLLVDVGLGYLRLGQPINTLSGGESQRLKLASHLAEAETTADAAGNEVNPGADESTLFIFDEPTTGLHFDDVRVLLRVFQRLVDAGHSVLVIEHNLEVIKTADWLIDLGPDAGDDGGQLVVAGTPEQVAGCDASHTGRALREMGIRPAAR